jgi:SAM-dependent methyltransferase
MATGGQKVNGSAPMQGDLWGARARDWAEVQEGTVQPLFEAGLRKLSIGPGTLLLDVGCGAGMACQMAAQRGAKVTGIDASAPFIEIAQQRTPGGDFRVGEIEDLPYADKTFHAVMGFNSFQFATTPLNALKEARRAAKPGAKVLIATWGKADQCEASTYFRALGSLLPPPLPGVPGPFALSEEGALEALVSQAGLTSVEALIVDTLWIYADLETALRGLLSPGPAVRAIRNSSEQQVREAVTNAIAPFKSVSGEYRLENEFRYLIATA